jgi:hypothetical protein
MMTQEELVPYWTKWWKQWLETATKELKKFKENLEETENKFDDWEDCKEFIQELEELSAMERWDFGRNLCLTLFMRRMLRDLEQLDHSGDAYEELISDLQALLSSCTGEISGGTP